MSQRIGIGYDIHRLTEDRKLFLGGIEIPYTLGLYGHSDADVLLHAICDALLGAISAGDIGENFPDTDPKYHNVSSVELLDSVMKMMSGSGYRIANVDTVLIAEEPLIFPFKKKIQANVASLLKINESCVSIKAKTNEGLDAVGKKEGIVAYAVVLLTKED
ncbi:MAG: 2-C-methyl-D-erythritol 2,4-cyclodiphosphate synthase [Candidatus Omnitrophica bacterium]|nr:2-C-methyl-D-erythritol 2,4-cyclodiphosphate synthase [Candidatus Omnitrophota bacterium]